MYQRIQILKSKLLMPHPSDILKRERLYPLLEEVLKKRITTVTAGAGFGKTTLIADACQYLNTDIIWYRLDKTDKDYITFLSYLFAGMNKYFPDFGKETYRRIEEAQIFTREREAILTSFLSEIETNVKEDLIIVLDDYHLIQDSNEIKESLEFIFEKLPSTVHLIIISRTDPDLHLSRFRARREILDIREEELIFTIPEIEELYLKLFNMSLKDENLKILHKKTDGWISSLILFYHSLKGKDEQEIEKQLLKLKGSHRIISNYLEENVYALQPDEIKEFLVKTSILSRLNAPFCDKLLGIKNSKNILKRLEENHLFAFPFDEEREWYYYHHLFQDFLQTKLHHELSRRSVRCLYKNAAMLWEKREEEEEALKHYLEAEQYEKACPILSRLGRKLVNEGRLQLIGSYLKRIPENYLDKEPWLQYTQARALELYGRPREAIFVFQKALKNFQKYNVHKGIGFCQHALGYNYYLTGDFKKSERRLKDLLKQVENTRLRIDIMANLIFVTSHLGKMTVADQYYKEAMTLLTELRNDALQAFVNINQGFRYGCSGDFNRALQIGEQMREIYDNQRVYYLIAMNYHLISWSNYYLGNFSDGYETAIKGLSIVNERGFKDHNLAWLHMDLALNASALDKTEEAESNGNACLSIFKDIENRWGEAYAYHILQGVYMKSGNLATAEKCARSGLEAIEGLSLPLETGYLKWGLAEVLIVKGQFEDAGQLLTKAEKLLRKTKWFLSRVHISFAKIFWETGKKDDALSKLLPALKLCEENQYDQWIITEAHWITPLLIELHSKGKMQDYIQKIFNDIGPIDKKDFSLLDNIENSKLNQSKSILLDEIQEFPSPSLKIYCLGEFRVFRGDEEIPSNRWKSKKAKTLFKYLICMRQRGYLSKEILMELLWPDEDPAKTAPRLHATLPTLRKILEPEIKKGMSSSYLLREGDSYKLNIGKEGWVDVDEFRREIEYADKEADSQKQISHLLNAEALYRGDYLEEDPYAEWCDEERINLREEYLKLLSKIISHYESVRDFEKCIEYSRKYLKRDKFAENVYQQLMRYYSHTGNKSMVTRTFERCKENITNDMDYPLSSETEALYKKLVSL